MAAGRVYRFSPLVLGPDELGLMHATDERVSFEMLGFMCRFFNTFIKTMSL
jgi:acetylornithine deacetylase/succinyl-diaminopimelate desuccinylase-like protein